MRWGLPFLWRRTPQPVRTPANPFCRTHCAYDVRRPLQQLSALALLACTSLSSLVFLALLSLFPAAPAVASESVLRVLAWPGYADGDVVKAFEARFHATVEVTLVDSDEALWDKMHAGAAPQYDVLAANTAEIQRYRHEHMLAPLDLKQLPNTRRQLPRFQARTLSLIHI